jgi:flagellum-specific peptidoglycan hydrolase FlgJ
MNLVKYEEISFYQKIRQPYFRNMAKRIIVKKIKEYQIFGIFVAIFISLLGFKQREKVMETKLHIFKDTVYVIPDKIVKRKRVGEKNDAAPSVNFAEISAKEYIGKYKSLAVEIQKKYGIPASITLAQGLIESRAGNSTLARQNNNHFGIKCHSKNCKKGHCTNHTDDTHKDFFRKFSTVRECYEARAELLSNYRYKSLKKHGNDYVQWAYGLKKKGYATDKNYATKLIGVINKYQLNKIR